MTGCFNHLSFSKQKGVGWGPEAKSSEEEVKSGSFIYMICKSQDL